MKKQRRLPGILGRQFTPFRRRGNRRMVVVFPSNAAVRRSKRQGEGGRTDG